MCISKIYAGDSDFYLTFVQPFFDSSYTLLGVLAIDISLTKSGIVSANEIEYIGLKGGKAEMAVTQHLGE